jgi:hypothetical protein
LARGIDAKSTEVFKPIEHCEQIGRRRRFGIPSQPGKAGPPQSRIEGQQIFERLSRCIGQPLGQGLKRSLASAHARGEPNSFQHRRGRDKDALGPQVREHCLHDRLAAVSRPGGVGADLQASAPVRQMEAAQVQVLLQFEQMLPPSLGPMRVVFKQLRIGAHLVGNKSQHRRRRHFRRFERPAGVPEGAQLDREAQAIAGTALGPHQHQVLGTERAVLRHLGGFGGDAEQSRALFGGKQGSAGHRVLRVDAAARS